MGVDLSTWAKTVTERLNEKITHVYTMVDQKLEYQHKYLEQRLDSMQSAQSDKLLTMSVRLEEALAEIRGYKDILQQQLTVVDSMAKRSHERLDESNAQAEKVQIESEQTIQRAVEQFNQQALAFTERITEIENQLKAAQKSISTLEQTELIENTQKQTLKEDPIRKFLGDNAQKILLFVLAGIGIYLVRNLGSFLQSLVP